MDGEDRDTTSTKYHVIPKIKKDIIYIYNMRKSPEHSSFSRRAFLIRVTLSKNVYALGECMYQISGLYRFWLGHLV